MTSASHNTHTFPGFLCLKFSSESEKKEFPGLPAITLHHHPTRWKRSGQQEQSVSTLRGTLPHKAQQRAWQAESCPSLSPSLSLECSPGCELRSDLPSNSVACV